MKIAVYGASGYTGRLVAAELHRRDIEIVLCGRDGGRLRRAAGEAGITEAELRPAGVEDPPALINAFRDCDAVINCAGPFAFLGEPVVRAAISAGCHYVDTTGEQPYIKRIFDGCARPVSAWRTSSTIFSTCRSYPVPRCTANGLS